MPDPSLFSSALPVSRHLVTRSTGLEPLAVVAGSSIYHIGWQMPLWSRAGELATVTRALNEARTLALGRLREAAARLGADGVAGINLEVRPNSPGPRLSEVVATGTAVRCRAQAFPSTPDGLPFTSSLSGQDLSLLMRAGFRPVSLVAGTCVYHAGYQGAETWFSQIGRNVEMPTFTQALSEARALALDQMQAEATVLGATGILGITLTEHAHTFGSHVVECFVVGTAFAESGKPTPLGDLPFILSLSDPLPIPPVVEPPVASVSDGVDVVSVDVGS